MLWSLDINIDILQTTPQVKIDRGSWFRGYENERKEETNINNAIQQSHQ